MSYKYKQNYPWDWMFWRCLGHLLKLYQVCIIKRYTLLFTSKSMIMTTPIISFFHYINFVHIAILCADCHAWLSSHHSDSFVLGHDSKHISNLPQIFQNLLSCERLLGFHSHWAFQGYYLLKKKTCWWAMTFA